MFHSVALAFADLFLLASFLGFDFAFGLAFRLASASTAVAPFQVQVGIVAVAAVLSGLSWERNLRLAQRVLVDTLEHFIPARFVGVDVVVRQIQRTNQLLLLGLHGTCTYTHISIPQMNTYDTNNNE